MRPNLRTILIGALTVGLLAFFLRNANLRQVWHEIGRARLDLIAAAVGVTGVTYVLRALRWQYLLQPVGAARFASAFRATIIGFAALSLLPARAGEVVRPYVLARREGLSATAVFATIVIERLLDLLTVLLLFGAFVWLFDPGMAAVDRRVFNALTVGGAVSAAGALAVLGVVFVLAGHPERLGRATLGIERVLPPKAAHVASRLVRLFAEGLAVMRRPGPLAAALALSFPVWLSIALGIWLASRALHITFPYTGSFLLLALLVVGVSVPTPGGIGGFHAAYQIGATAFYAAPNDRAVGAALVLHAISFVPVTLLGILFMAQDGLNLTRARSLASLGGDAAAAASGLARPEAGGDADAPRTAVGALSPAAEDEGRAG